MFRYFERRLQQWVQTGDFEHLRLGRASLRARWSTPPRFHGCWSSLVLLAESESEDAFKSPLAGGFSLDSSLSRASIRALMEALEFVAAKDAGMILPSRTGLAAHRTLKLAQSAAFQELVERDAFLYHWLTETPAVPCEFLFPFSSELNREFRPQLVELESATPVIQVFCVASVHPELKCWMIGLGAGPNREVAERKAWLEWLASVYRHREVRGCPPVPESDGPRRWISVHHEESKNVEVSALCTKILRPSFDAISSPDGQVKRDGSALFEQSRFIQLPSRNSHYAVVLAKNSELLPLYFGPEYFGAREEYLRNPRLRNLDLRRLEYHQNDKFLPHPFD